MLPRCQLADLFTKALSSSRFCYLVHKMSIMNVFGHLKGLCEEHQQLQKGQHVQAEHQKLLVSTDEEGIKHKDLDVHQSDLSLISLIDRLVRLIGD